MKITKKLLSFINNLFLMANRATLKFCDIKKLFSKKNNFIIEDRREKIVKAMEKFISNKRYHDFLQIDSDPFDELNNNHIIINHYNSINMSGVRIRDFNISIFDKMEVTFDRDRIIKLLANFTLPVEDALMCNHLCIAFHFKEDNYSVDTYSFLNNLFINDAKKYASDLYSVEMALELIEYNYLNRSIVMEHLPEMFIPSAYDFSSESFNQRKQLVKILSY